VTQDPYRERCVQRINQDMVEKIALHFVSEGRHDLGNERIVNGISRLELDGPAAHHIGNDSLVGRGALQSLHKSGRG
jgi:hypothetical protein